MSVSVSSVSARPIPRTLKAIKIEDTGTTIALLDAVENQSCYVWGAILFTDGATDLTILSDATDVSGPLGGGVSSGPGAIVLDKPHGQPEFTLGFPHFVTSPGEALNLGNSAGARVSGLLWVEQPGG